MPKKVDHAQRRRLLADALWRVIRRDGWEAVSLRQVAAEADVSMGMVQHYFATKDQMLQFAMERIGADLQSRLAERVAALPQPHRPRAVVETVLGELLPRGAEGQVEVQASAAFLGRAVLRPEIAADLAVAARRLTDYLVHQLRRADQGLSGEAAEREAGGLLAMVDGLIAHLLTGRQTAESARAILHGHLDRLFASLESPTLNNAAADNQY